MLLNLVIDFEWIGDPQFLRIIYFIQKDPFLHSCKNTNDNFF